MPSGDGSTPSSISPTASPHDTFGRAFALDPDQLQRRFLAWVQQTMIQTDGAVIARDGSLQSRPPYGC